MSFIAGDILIRMAADVASLRKDMDASKSVVEQATSVMKAAAIGLAGAFSAQMFVGWIRSAIDAGDEMNKLSQKTGIAAEDIAGLQLAFRLGGVESGTFGTSMAKLSKQIVEGNDAFKYLGISVRDANGNVRSAKDVLYDVADAFKASENGAGKTALAMEIFGKTGAELIPILNTGSEGLREMDEMAAKLGLTMSTKTVAEAEAFNDTLDLIGLSGQGMARQIATQLLPTLQGLAGAFLKSMTEGDALRNVADVLAAALKGLFSAGVIGVEIFSTLGKAIGATGAAVVAVLNGDFRQAAQIGKDFASDIRTDWSKAANTIESAWNGSSASTVAAMAAQQAALRKLAQQTKEQEEAAKKAAEAAKKHAEELDKAAEAIKLENAGLTADYLRKLRELVALRDSGRLSTEEYVKAVESLIQKQPAIKKAAEDQKRALEDEAKASLAALAAYEKREQAIDDGIVKAQGMVDAIKRETAALTMSNTEREISNALLALEKTGLEKGTAAYEEYAEQIRKAIIDKQAVADSIAQTKTIADEWSKAAKGIEDGLTDALMRGFEGGKSFVDNIKDYIKNAFKTLVADFIIRPIIAPVAGGLASIFSGNAFAGGGAGGGGIGNLFGGISNFLNGGLINGQIGNAFNSFATSNFGASLGLSTPIDFGTGFTANIASSGANMLGSALGMAGNGFAGYGISKAISGGYTTGGNFVNVVSGIASAFFGPIAGVIGGLVNRAFGRKLADQGIEGTFGGGDFDGQNYAFYKGGWFRSDKTNYSDMDAGLEQSLSVGAAAILNQTKAYAEALKLPADQLAAITSTMRISLTDDAAKNEQLIAEAMGNYADALAASFADVVAPFQKEGEKVIDTLARLSAMTAFADALNEYGGIFSRIAQSSYEAQDALIELAGGMENLGKLAGQFISLYYTEAEQIGLQARQLANTINSLGFTEQDYANAGISADAAISREQFRALVESRDVDTQIGREQLVALLGVSGSFAQLSDYMAEQGLTFNQLLEAAPQVELLSQMIDPQQTTATNTTDMATGIRESNGILNSINTQLNSIQVASAAAAAAAAAAADAASRAASAASSAADTASLAASQPTYSFESAGA